MKKKNEYMKENKNTERHVFLSRGSTDCALLDDSIPVLTHTPKPPFAPTAVHKFSKFCG